MPRVLKQLLAVLVVGGLSMVSLSGFAMDCPSPDRPVGWRIDGSGQYPTADPVTRWSSTENVVWKTEIGTGHSSPVLIGSRLFITAEPDLLICLDTATGRELWRKAHKLSDLPVELGAKAPRQREHYGDTTPTPVSDGQRIWVFLNTGIVACHDLDGTCRWIQWYDMRLTSSYGRAASPLLVGDRLLVHFGPLVCLDAATGKVLWQNDLARATYGTPAAASIGDLDVVITPKGQIVRVADGEILATGLGPCGYTSPVVLGGVVYFIDRDVSAFKLPEKAGEQIEGEELWYEQLAGDFYASPLIYDGRVYAVDRAANYYVIDAATGEIILTKHLDLAGERTDGPNVYPSICLAGKHIFIGNDAGKVMLLDPGDDPTVVAVNSLPGGSGATPIFRDRRMFLRSGKVLYCIGQ